MGKKNKKKANKLREQRRHQKRVTAMKAACAKLGLETNNSLVIARKILFLQGRKLENERQFHVDAIISAFVKLPIDDCIAYKHLPQHSALTKIKRATNKSKYEKKTKKTKRKQRKNETFYDSKEWRAIRWEVLVKYGFCCMACGRSKKEHGVILHVDHIKPRSKFPELELKFSNLQVLCQDCNLGKSNTDDTDLRPKSKSKAFSNEEIYS